MKKIAVIVAGGTGSRMQSELPKQFLLLNNKTLLWHSINAFVNTYNDIEIIIASHKDYIEKTKSTAAEFANKTTVVAGGDTRFQSVKNGLNVIKDDAVIFVHDAVRCLVSKTLIERCYEQALAKGSAIPAVTATDSIRLGNNDEHKMTDRNNVRIIQTPQTFSSSILLPAYDTEYNEAFTDEATVVEASGKKVYLAEGDYNNIKITRPLDLEFASLLIKNNYAS